jgi:molybdopterin molybdotransferase
MLSIGEALQLVLDRAQPLSPHTAALDEVLGCVLAETVVSDIDSPPHDKSIVDGYALIAADIHQTGVELTVLEQIVAGAVPTRTVERGTASQIMTGAPLPRGADAVVMVEQTQAAGDRVRILPTSVKSGRTSCVMRPRWRAGRRCSRQEATASHRDRIVGGSRSRGVTVVPKPRVAVLATGNELVDAALIPGAVGQQQQRPLGWFGGPGRARAVPLGIARDDSVDLRKHVEFGLAQDVLVLSGGVSAGVLDLVPQVLAGLGVKQVFHKVNLKPGKPLWFGVKEQTLVFGLPGNPVSSLVCFELFVRPAIEKLSGRPPKGLPRLTAKLTQDHKQRGDRPTYWPAVFSQVAVGGAADHGTATPNRRGSLRDPQPPERDP